VERNASWQHPERALTTRSARATDLTRTRSTLARHCVAPTTRTRVKREIQKQEKNVRSGKSPQRRKK